MNFVGLLRLLMRRWWIALLGFVLSVGAAAGAYTATPPTYEAGAQTIVLLPPTANPAEDATSPFLYLPGGLLVLAQIVSVIPNSPDFREAMARDGYETTYTVQLQAGTPVATFVVEGATPESTLSTRDELVRRFQLELRRIQTDENVPERQLARARILEASSNAAPQSGDRLRAAALAGVVGAVLTLIVVVLVDKRRNRRNPRPEGPAKTA